jgi:hypothetical protein
VLDRGDEGKLDRLPRDDHRSGLVLARGGRLEQSIGVRLQPREISRRRGRRGRVARLRDLRRRDPARPAAKHVEARVRRDPVEPSPKRGAPAGAEARALAPRAQKGLLDQILGVLERAEQPIAVNLQLPSMALEERSERGLLARDRQLLGGAHRRI